MKTAYLRNAEAWFSTIQIDGEPKGPLEIVRATDPASVDVKVTGDGQANVGGVTVVLVPDAVAPF